MKPLVLDTSTLVLLAKADLLEQIAQETSLLIPEKVRDEAVRKRELQDTRQILRLIEEGKLLVERKLDRGLVESLRADFQLGPGEAQALALAKIKGCLLGIDDRLAMKASKAAGVPFATALAFLTRIWERGGVSRRQALAKLEKLKQYGWYQNDLVRKVREEIEGRKEP